VPEQKPLLVFDGVCVLCSRILRWVLWADYRKQQINYATAQSGTGQDALKKHGYNTEKFETVLLIMPDGWVFDKSDVPIEVAKILGGFWHAVRVFKILPKSWRDGLYDFVAQRRYRWFGKCDYCAMLPEKYRDRIIR
jgi:predicted DCC family thiol-disulfide oxidoreductase YuxK